MEGGDEAATIRADSTYAGNLASGVWKAKANGIGGARLSALGRGCKPAPAFMVARQGTPRTWNERADHLAARHANGELPEPLTF